MIVDNARSRFSSSTFFRVCSPLSRRTVTPATKQKTPLNMSARFMFKGGRPSGPARSACWAVKGQEVDVRMSATKRKQAKRDLHKTNTIDTTFPLRSKTQERIALSVIGTTAALGDKDTKRERGMQTERDFDGKGAVRVTHIDHKIAELA